MFIDNLENEFKHAKTLTENGGVGYVTSGRPLVDLNFKVPSLRGMTEDEVVDEFIQAFVCDREMAVKWLFFLRDVRGGMGERRSFRYCSSWLADAYPKQFIKLLPLIPMYGRWDDLIYLLGESHSGSVTDEMLCIVTDQLYKDIDNMRNGEPVSLLAKWMPRLNSKSPQKVIAAKKIKGRLGVTNKEYRKMLRDLREHSNVLEVLMSDGRWDEIDFKAVPSRANLRYRRSFFSHCGDRYSTFLEDVLNGEQHIHSGVLYPHDIVHQYKRYNDDDMYVDGSIVKEFQPDLEALWKDLPRPVDLKKTIVVSDGSGSMEIKLPRSNARAIDVAQAMAIYFSETCVDEFKDKFITFSNRPQLIDLSGANTLMEKLRIIEMCDEAMNTNIEAVFELLLKVAIDNRMSQDELPEVVLIISDMEFDVASNPIWYLESWRKMDETVFEEISTTWAAHGYKLPKLVFWNVNSRTGAIPLQDNELGFTLVSGFSQNIVDMVTSPEIDPYKVLVERLMSARYSPVEFKLD